MGQSYFIWKNQDCRAMGCRLGAPAPIVRPEERVQHITIPGRSGDMTLLEGADVYNSYIQTVTLLAKGAARMGDIYDWLRGSDYVTFSGEPDKKQPARIIGAVTLNKHSHNLDWWEGEVQFYCQPFKELLVSKTTQVSNGSTVVNTGDVTERPNIAFEATGTTAVITCGGNTLTMTGLTQGNRYFIDGSAYMFMTAALDTDLTANTSGNFPTLNCGSNTFSCSGADSVTIYRKELFL